MPRVPVEPSSNTVGRTDYPRYPYVGASIRGRTLVDLGISSNVIGAKVDLDINKISLAELYFKNINPQMTDDITWREGQLMYLFLGYGNIPDRTRLQGKFTMSNPKFEFGGQRRIVIRGFGDGIEMTRIEKRRVFENTTYDQIVSQIADEYRYDKLISVDLRDRIDSVTQAGVNDYQFIRDLSARAGTDFFVFSNKLYFMVPAINIRSTPIIVDASGTETEAVVFSVIGEGEASLISSSPVNPLTGEFRTVSSEFYTDGILDVEADNQLRFMNIVHRRAIYVDGKGNLLSQSALKTMLDSEANTRKNVIKVFASIKGDERISPRQTVVFLNCGTRFAGPFYITRVVHEIESQGSVFRTRIEGIRASTGIYQQNFTPSDTIGGSPDPPIDLSHLSESEVEQ